MREYYNENGQGFAVIMGVLHTGPTGRSAPTDDADRAVGEDPNTFNLNGPYESTTDGPGATSSTQCVCAPGMEYVANRWLCRMSGWY